MTSFRSAGRSAAPSARAAALAAAFALALVGCARSPAAGPPVTAASLPLATSVATSGTSWVALPMGDLGEVTGTFWQLLVERPGSARFVVATPPGVADNGGLVEAPTSGPMFEVGFLTSQLLGFSPVATSRDGGRHWAGTVLPGPLTPVPDALAVAGSAPPTALFGRDGATVMSDRDRQGWRPVTGLAALRRATAASRCGLEALTAVAHVGPRDATTVVGGDCRQGGHPGLFVADGASWTDIGAALPAAAGAAAVEVVAIAAGPAVGGVGGYEVVGLSRDSSGSSLAVWDVGPASSPPAVTPRAPAPPPVELALPSGHELRAVGLARDGRILVLDAAGTTAAPRDEHVDVLDPGGSAWRPLPAPPARTQDVVSVAGRFEAFAVDRSRVTVYRLAGGHQWMPLEVIHISVPYGSSG